jgi:hypothetical protein
MQLKLYHGKISWQPAWKQTIEVQPGIPQDTRYATAVSDPLITSMGVGCNNMLCSLTSGQYHHPNIGTTGCDPSWLLSKLKALNVLAFHQQCSKAAAALFKHGKKHPA